MVSYVLENYLLSVELGRENELLLVFNVDTK